jgi:hypothetical protein
MSEKRRKYDQEFREGLCGPNSGHPSQRMNSLARKVPLAVADQPAG